MATPHQPPPPLTAADIRPGRDYSAKRPSMHGLFDPRIVDRHVLWVSADRARVQYDAPTVAIGRKQPVVTMAAFLKWAAADVTALMPEDGEWRRPVRVRRAGAEVQG